MIFLSLVCSRIGWIVLIGIFTRVYGPTLRREMDCFWNELGAIDFLENIVEEGA